MRNDTLDTESKMPHDVSDSQQRRGAGQSTPHSPRLSPMPNEIPLYTHDQRFVGMVGEAEAERIAGRLIRNRRGHITRAYLGGQDTMRPVSQGNAGESYEEHLECGWCWSMVMPPGGRHE